jgi:L-fuculose-phosphate aldolase
MSERACREAVLETAREMAASGLSFGRSGNVSARWGDGMIITPSGRLYDQLSPADLALVSGEGAWAADGPVPSSEWRFHLAVYAAREEARAIVHSHSRFATALASTGRAIPAFHYMVAVAGGEDIRCADYATFGTEALAANLLAALEGRKACLMAQHGQLAFGASPALALELAWEVETLAAIYCEVLKIGGERLLDEDEMQRVLAAFSSYGANLEKS